MMNFRCFLLYLPCICLSVSLTSLYRKSEGYPGPLVETETQPLDKKRRDRSRGHRRNPSGLPEVTHSRALPPVPGEARPHSRYRDTSAARNVEPPRYEQHSSASHSNIPSLFTDTQATPVSVTVLLLLPRLESTRDPHLTITPDHRTCPVVGCGLAWAMCIVHCRSLQCSKY